MYDKLLVAVDHSKASERVLAAARDLALLSKGEVWVVHLREREYAAKTGLVPSSETADDAQAQVDVVSTDWSTKKAPVCGWLPKITVGIAIL